MTRLVLGSDSGFKVGSVVHLSPEGKRNIFVQLEPAVIRIVPGVVTMTVTRRDGTTETRGPLQPAPEWLTKALADPAVARALRLRDDNGLGWVDLYRLFEVIAAGVGGASAMVDDGWCSHSQIRRFKHTANSVAAAGDEARHGVEQGTPPAHPMTLSEGRGFIDGLLRQWLQQ
jgi:hypothetical protein